MGAHGDVLAIRSIGGFIVCGPSFDVAAMRAEWLDFRRIGSGFFTRAAMQGLATHHGCQLIEPEDFYHRQYVTRDV